MGGGVTGAGGVACGLLGLLVFESVRAGVRAGAVQVPVWTSAVLAWFVFEFVPWSAWRVLRPRLGARVVLLGVGGVVDERLVDERFEEVHVGQGQRYSLLVSMFVRRCGETTVGIYWLFKGSRMRSTALFKKTHTQVSRTHMEMD